MVDVIPMPLDFVLGVVDAAAYEEPRRAFTFDGFFALAGFDGGSLGPRVTGYFGSNNGLLGDAVDAGSNGLDGLDVLATDIDTAIFIESSVDQAGLGNGFGRGLWSLLSRFTRTGAVETPYLIMI